MQTPRTRLDRAVHPLGPRASSPGRAGGAFGTLISLSLFIVFGCAGPTVVTGEVQDVLAGMPAAGVPVVLGGTTMGAVSGADGRFAITGVPAGTQTLGVDGGDWVVVSAPTFTVADGSSVSAAPLRVFAKPPGVGPGLWALADGKYTPLREPPDSEKIPGMVWAVWRGSVVQHLPDLEPGVDLILFEPGEVGHIGIRKFVWKEAWHRALTAHYALPSTDLSGYQFESISPGYYRLAGMQGEPGVYAVVILMGTMYKYWTFELVAPSPKIGKSEAGSGSAVYATGVGKWPMSHPVWGATRDLVLEWCGAAAGRCSGPQLEALREATPSANPACDGALTVAPDAVRLSTWECSGGLRVHFDRVKNGWVPRQVEEDEEEAH